MSTDPDAPIALEIDADGSGKHRLRLGGRVIGELTCDAATARRLAASFEACRDIPVPALEARMVEELARIARLTDEHWATGNAHKRQIWIKIRDALAWLAPEEQGEA